jgi:hypothetical protein
VQRVLRWARRSRKGTRSVDRRKAEKGARLARVSSGGRVGETVCGGASRLPGVFGGILNRRSGLYQPIGQSVIAGIRQSAFGLLPSQHGHSLDATRRPAHREPDQQKEARTGRQKTSRGIIPGSVSTLRSIRRRRFDVCFSDDGETEVYRLVVFVGLRGGRGQPDVYARIYSAFRPGTRSGPPTRPTQAEAHRPSHGGHELFTLRLQ